MSEQGAQPAEGQGAEPQDSPNAPYLADVPGELHPLVEEVLRKKDADFTKRFQQASEFRNQWEPYSRIDGLDQMDPEEVGNLVEFYNSMSNMEAFVPWLQGAARQVQEMGYDPYGLDEETWGQLGEQNGWFDAGDDETPGGQNGFDPSSIQEMMQQALEEQRQALQQELAPMKQFIGNYEQQQVVGQISAELDHRLTGLAKQHGLVLTDENGEETEQRQDILLIAQAFVDADENDPDPIGKAVEKYLRMTGKAQGDLMDTKLGQQNGNALGSGSADTSPERYAHDDPRIREAVLNRLRS